jgi:hypothetical protein
MAANQFCLLAALGLREHHTLLDVGCGSLRGGKLFLPYLLPGHYFGIEPESWLIDEGIAAELGRDIIRVKQPAFDHNRDFDLGVFGRKFDYVLAQSIFTHAAPPQVRKLLAGARQVMEPGSLFAANFLPGADHEGSTWTYPTNVTYTLEFLVAAARAEGLIALPLTWPVPRLQWLLLGREENRERVEELAAAVGSAGALRELEAARRRLAELEDAAGRDEARARRGLGARLRRLLRRG